MTRETVVVVGAGMVGHRFVEELVTRDPGGRFDVHLVGAEQYEPYNRILLTEVLAGRASLRALTLGRVPERVRVHRGTSVARLDRQGQEVLLDDGERLGYDRVVLATGARAFVPPLDGLEEQPLHVHVLRDLDDTRAVTARAENARHAVVLGGGVLGLEAACGLAARGVAVTVVQDEPQLMAGQLDPAPAAVLGPALADLGVRIRLGCSVAEVISAYGELVAVRLTDGTVMAADMMLVSCGVRPRTELAAAAGLPVERGVVVDASLTSPADRRVHALGDCAQPPEGTSGLLAPGWAQAESLATELTTPGSAPGSSSGSAPDGSGATGSEIRLKAVGVDLVTLGVRASAAGPDDRVVSVSDVRGRRHIDLVTRGGRLVGATCLGAPAVAADLSVLVARGTPVPADPLALLTPERPAEETSPLRMPAGTTVCRCNNVTKGDLVAAWEDGATSVDALARRTRATTGCGGCTQVVCGIADWLATCDPPVEEAPGPDRCSSHPDGPQVEQHVARA
jgi:assimilatory nitrate reductase electron transfer subunit